jgi:hypothetical protein
MSAPAVRGSSTALNPRLVLLLTLAVVVAIAMLLAVVLKLRGGSTLDLTGHWVARQGVTTVDLSLRGSGNDLTGSLRATNAPVPIQGTVALHVTGSKATAEVQALGQALSARCTVSNSEMACTGTGDNRTLTLTFTRP